MDPSVERRFPAKTADRLVSLGENVLQQVVRVLVVRGHVVDQPVETWRIFHDQIVERARVPRLSAPH